MDECETIGSRCVWPASSGFLQAAYIDVKPRRVMDDFCLLEVREPFNIPRRDVELSHTMEMLLAHLKTVHYSAPAVG